MPDRAANDLAQDIAAPFVRGQHAIGDEECRSARMVMGSVPGALLGGLMIGVIESLGGLYFGESLGQLGIFVTFILVLLLRPSGLLGARA